MKIWGAFGLPVAWARNFGGQDFQQLVVEAVFRLFNADERRRVRVFHQEQVGKEFQRAVGHLLCIERVYKAPVVEAEEKTAVYAALRVNLLNARNSSGDFL